jgi:ribonucleotide reductase beta subunit family protein with ferritin-like domain
MFIFLFVISIIFEVILSLVFLKKTKQLFNVNSDEIEVFDRRYSSISRLYLDFNFINDLLDGKKINILESNLTKKNQLSSLRKILILQVILGVVLFFSGILSGLTQ